MESVIFSHQGVTVAYNHFSVNGKTYLIEDNTSVEGHMLMPKRMHGLALMLIGLLFWKATKVRYALVVHRPAGEHQPLIREDSQDIANVLSALNVAIAMKSGTS